MEKEVSREGINREQYPDWAEFVRTSETKTTVKAKADFLLEADGGAAFHSNRALLDVIDQAMAKANAVEFAGVTETPDVITGTDTLATGSYHAQITTADALTLTIPAGYPIGTRISIVRTVTSTAAVTLARSGSETIQGAATWISHEACTTTRLNTAQIVIEKISATAWIWVAGIIDGNNSNGEYIKWSDGTMMQWGQGISGTAALVNNDIGTYGWSYYQVTVAITFPTSFIDTNYTPTGSTNGTGFQFAEGTKTPSANSMVAFNVSSAAMNYRWIAIGRWKA
jgi:hypothetical protein